LTWTLARFPAKAYLPMPKTILVVEDNSDTRELMHLHLKTEGYNVITASDGREGLYLASAEHPDLIITDLNMPEVNGLDLIKQLRSLPDFKEIPIIILTAFGLDTQDEAIKAGASRSVSKPTHFDFLIDDVRELLDGQNSEE
jgi:CheY-like chemotaxis protein